MIKNLKLKIFKFILTSLAIVLLFLLRLQFMPKLDLKDGQKIRITGFLTEEPQISGNRQILKLSQFEIWTKRYPEYHYGEKIEVVGKLKVKPTHFFLLNISRYLIEKGDISSISAGNPKNTKGAAIGLRRRMLAIYKRVFSQTMDGIVAGVVLGDKSLTDEYFWRKLQETGTLHIMVASGMNIAMFSRGLFSFFLLFFKRRLAIYFLIIVIWFYSIMTGLSPPMIRAATMASLIYLGSVLGKETEGGRILLLTGLLMVFVNPALILETSFQLSFMAMAGLVYLQPKLKEIESPQPLRKIMQFDNFSSSLASLVATLPILLFSFGSLNLLSPFTNLIILWTIPFVLQVGMAIGILGLLWIKLAELASYLLYPFLFFLEQTITLFANLTFFQIGFPRISGWWVIFYYVILWLWVKKKIDNC